MCKNKWQLRLKTSLEPPKWAANYQLIILIRILFHIFLQNVSNIIAFSFPLMLDYSFFNLRLDIKAVFFSINARFYRISFSFNARYGIKDGALIYFNLLGVKYILA